MTRLVHIDSFLNRPLAEFAQLQLKAAAIDSSLGNVTLVAWVWPVGLAVGGIKLFVKDADTAQAREILAPSELELPQAPQSCPQCHEPLMPGWGTCWRCAYPPADTSTEPLETNAPDEERDQTVLAAGAATMGLATFLACGPMWLVIVAASMGIVHLLFELGGADTPADQTEEPPPVADDARPTRRRSDLIEELACRAWRAAVIALLYFPPLAPFSLWLARRIGASKIPLSTAGRRRRAGALIVGGFGLAVLALCVVFVFPVAAAIYSTIYREAFWPSEP